MDALRFDDPNRFGFFGAYGNRWANTAIAESDFLLVLGSRLDIRQTGADVDFFARRRIFQVDCEEGEINNRVKGCSAIVADLRDFLPTLFKVVEGRSFADISPWRLRLKELRETMSDLVENSLDGTINPNQFMHQLSTSAFRAAAYTVDVGCHQMWAAQSIELQENQQFLTSGGMGAMGYSLPAAVGAAVALNAPTVVIVGDGSFQLNIQELQTVVRNNLPLKIVVINNKSLGMIRQFQDSYFESRHQSTVWGYSVPDFANVASAYGMEALTIESPSQVPSAIEWLWENPNQPQLLNVHVDLRTNAWPKIAFGRPLHEMEPDFHPREIEGT